MKRARLRDLGIATGRLPPGPWNAITDVPGVKVGYASLVHDTPVVARTGVTAMAVGAAQLHRGAAVHVADALMTADAPVALQGSLCSRLPREVGTELFLRQRKRICRLDGRERLGPTDGPGRFGGVPDEAPYERRNERPPDRAGLQARHPSHAGGRLLFFIHQYPIIVSRTGVGDQRHFHRGDHTRHGPLFLRPGRRPRT